MKIVLLELNGDWICLLILLVICLKGEPIKSRDIGRESAKDNILTMLGTK